MFDPPTDSCEGEILSEKQNKDKKKYKILFLGESPIAGIGLKS